MCQVPRIIEIRSSTHKSVAGRVPGKVLRLEEPERKSKRPLFPDRRGWVRRVISRYAVGPC